MEGLKAGLAASQIKMYAHDIKRMNEIRKVWKIE